MVNIVFEFPQGEMKQIKTHQSEGPIYRYLFFPLKLFVELEFVSVRCCNKCFHGCLEFSRVANPSINGFLMHSHKSLSSLHVMKAHYNFPNKWYDTTNIHSIVCKELYDFIVWWWSSIDIYTHKNFECFANIRHKI